MIKLLGIKEGRKVPPSKTPLKPSEKTFLSVLSNFPMQNQLDTENETKCVNRVDRKMKRGLQHFIVCFSFMLKNDYHIFFFFIRTKKQQIKTTINNFFPLFYG